MQNNSSACFFRIALILALALPVAGCARRTSGTTAGVVTDGVTTQHPAGAAENGADSQAAAEHTQPGARLQPPAIPASLTDPEKRVEYLAVHYWDHYDFADTTLMRNADYTEQAFVDFIYLLPNVSETSVRHAVGTLIGSAAADPAMFGHFTELAEQYLYDPNSPMRSEELYIPFLEAVIALPSVDSLLKIRPRYQLAMALKNRPGAVASDFTYATAAGKTGRLSALRSDYTLILFYDPDCPDCKRVKQYITDSQVFGKLIAGQDGNSPVFPEGERPLSGGRNGGGKSLTVLAIYPDADFDAWRSHLSQMPPAWTVGCDKAQALRGKELYDLKAIPTLYLLDGGKRVIFKDAPVEQIEAWLAPNAG